MVEVVDSNPIPTTITNLADYFIVVCFFNFKIYIDTVENEINVIIKRLILYDMV